MSRVYVLRRNLSHLVDVDTDAWMVKFPGCEDIALSSINDCEVPEPLEFRAIFEEIKTSDYPVTRPSWPIMSKRMLEALTDIKDFPHKALPVRMINSKVIGEKDGEDVISGEVDDSFVAVQLLEHLEIFDWEASVYERSFLDDDTVGSIEKLVLIEPAEGFPPIFRMKENFTILFVSEEAKRKLEDLNIKGIIFESLEDYTL